MKRIFTSLLFLFTIFNHALQAQPTVQDCAGAIPICQNSYSTTTGYTGVGNINDIPASSCPTTCMSAGERNSVWYTFTVTTSGLFDFRITPYVSSDDYDWSLFNLSTDDCSALQNTALLATYEISCNWSADGGITGANGLTPNTGTDCWDASATANNPAVWVTAGQTYYLNISNYTGYGAGHGYQLDMTHSTASIFDNVRPYMLNATATGCGATSITVTMSENVLCSTVSAADFTVAGQTVTGVTGNVCASGGSQENTFVLTVSPGLGPGTHTVCINGSAGHITDLCGNATNPAAPANCRTITIPGVSTTVDASPNAVCSGSPSTLTAAGSTSYSWSHSLGTGNPVTVNPTSNTTYTVTGTTGGCTSSAAVTVSVVPIPSVTISASANPICVGASTTLTASGATSYSWSSGLGTNASVSVSPGTTTSYTVTGTTSGCTNTAAITVTVNPKPTVTATATPASICTGGSTSLSASGASTYSWSNGLGTGTPVTASPASTTTYTVTGTSAAGCTNTSTVTVTVGGSITVSLTPAASSVCPGGSTTLTAGGATSYVWSHGLSGNPVTVTPAGTTTYSVTGTGASGCTGSTTTTITVNPNPTVTASASPVNICQGASSSLTGGGASTYAWNNGLGSGSPVTTTPGTTTAYTVTGTSAAGCTGTATVTVNVNPVTANAGADMAQGACASSTNTLSGSGTGTAPLSYSWAPATGLSNVNIANPVANPASTTTYTLTVTNGTGCTASDAMVVTVNTLSANAGADGNSGACASSTYTLSGSATGTAPFSYSWTPATGLSNTTIANPIADPASTTTYTLTVTDSYGCTASDAAVVNVAPLPTANAGTDATIGACATAANATLSGSGTGTSITYAWTPTTGLSNPAIASPVADPAATSTYTLTVTDTYGCTASDAAVVTVAPLPTANAGADANIGACASAANATLNGSGTGTSITYAWSPATGLSNPAIASPVADPAATTTYTLTVTDTYGCTVTDAAVVTVVPLPTANAGADANIGACASAANANLSGSGTGSSITYAWTPTTGLSNPAIAAPVADPAATSTYTLTVTDSYGCTASDAVVVNVAPLPTANAGTDATIGACAAAANATLSGSGTGTSISYAWTPTTGLSNPAIATPVADPAATSTYTLTVTDTYGCTASDAAVVTMAPLPTANAGADANIGACATAANATLNGSGTGTSITYAWSPATGLSNPAIASPVADPAATTTYTLTVTDTYGCTVTDAAIVNVAPMPTANAGTDGSLGACTSTGYNISGSGTGTAPLSYSWTPVAGLSNPSIANPVALPVSTTTYTLTIQDAYGCTASDAVIVSIIGGPTANAGADGNIGTCPSSTYNVNGSGTGTGTLTYAWSPAAGLSNTAINNPVAKPAATTTYTLTITDGNGCTASDAMVVNVAPLPTSNAGTDATIGACPAALNANLNGSATGTAPLSYAWTPATGLSNPAISNPVADPASTTTYTLTVTDTYGCTASDAVIITVAPMPTANAGTDASIGACVSAANANLNGSGTGNPTLTYSWSPTTGLSNPSITNPVADPAATTNYTLTVTDTYGCTASDAVVVTVAPLPTANAGTDANIGACASALNANLNGTGTGTAPLAYSWSPATGLSNPGINNPVADPVATTTYTLNVTDTYGCSATDAVIVNVAPLPTAAAGTDASIGGCATALNANLNGSGTGTAPLSYGWSPATGLSNPAISNPVADPAASTTYTLTVSDTYGCTATDAVVVTVDPLPTANAGSDANIGACATAANANLSGSGTGTATLTYAWTPVAGLSNPATTNPVADPASTTNYTLTVSDAYGCTASDAVAVNVAPLPSSNAGADANIGGCVTATNANLNGSGTGTAPLGYAWSPVTGLSNPGITNPAADPTTTTNYTLTVTDTYGCTATDAMTVTVAPVPTANAGLDATIGGCAAALNANLNGSGTGNAPLSYSWTPVTGLSNPAINNPVADPAVTTNYTITVTDSYGCTASDAVLVTVAPVPTANAGADANIGACASAANASLNGSGSGTAPLGYSWSPATGLSNSAIANPVADPSITTNYTLTVTDAFGCVASDEVVVTVAPMPTANAGTDANIGACATAANASLNGTATGTPTLTYSWTPTAGLSNPGIINPVADPAATTTYTLTVTDTYGCSASDAAVVTVAPLPTANAGSDVTIGGCPAALNANLGGTGTGTPTLTYAWTPASGLSNAGITNPVADPVSTTTYTFTVTDTYGCTAFDAVVVTVAPLPTANAGSDVSIGACATAANASLNGTGTGTPTLTYLWTPATGISNPVITNPTADPAVTTAYTLTVSDAFGCQASDALTVTVDPLPTASAGNDATVGGCVSAANVTLTGNGTGTLPISYAWSPTTGLSNPTISNPVADPPSTVSYTLTVTDVYGCTANDVVIINVDPVPTANAGSDGSFGVCSSSGYNINGSGSGTSPLTYSWNPGTGLSNISIANPVATPPTSTNYILTVSDVYGCTATDNVFVTVIPGPSANAGADGTIGSCPTSTYTLNGGGTGTGTLSYSWLPTSGLSSTAINNPVAHPTVTTTYTLTVTDGNGCTASDAVVVNVMPLPVITVSPAAPSICAGGNVNLTANGGISYSWSPSLGLSSTSGASVSASPTITTAYTVTGSDIYNCTNTAVSNVTVIPVPVISVVPAAPSMCVGDSVVLTASGASSYNWSPAGGLNTTSGAAVTADPGATMTYTVTGSTSGCSSTASVMVTVNPLPIVSFGILPNVCENGASITLTSGSPAGGFYSGPGVTGTSLNPATAGAGSHMLTYTYTDANNCTSSATQNIMIIAPPDITVTPATPSVCIGGSVVLAASGAITYDWYPPTSLSDTVGSTVTASPVTATTYVVTGTSQGCTNSTSVTVTMYTIDVQIIPGNVSVCPGEYAVLTATGASTYTWSPPQGLSDTLSASVSASPQTSTTYIVTGVDNAGCVGTAAVVVDIYPNVMMNFFADPNPGCPPLNVEFTFLPSPLVEDSSWVWDFGDPSSGLANESYEQSPSHLYYNDGEYIVTLSGTTTDGCAIGSTDTILVYNAPVADFIANPETVTTENPIIDFIDQSSGANAWVWNFGDPLSEENNISHLQYDTHYYQDSGSYTVTLIVTNEDGCSDTISKNVNVIDAFAFFIPNAFTPNDDVTNSVFLPKGVGFKTETFQMWIFDRWGKKIFYTKNIDEGWNGINTHTGKYYPQGVYTYMITLKDERNLLREYFGSLTLIR